MESSSALSIIGHRGASADAPENTLAAFALAWEQGADAIEGDFRLTADGEVVCLHDETAERTGGGALEVAATTLAELRALEFGGWKDAAWQGEPLPTLEQVLDTLPEGGALYAEIKSGAETMPAVRDVFRRSGKRPEQVIVISFDPAVIAASKQLLPELRAFWITGFKEQEGGTWSPTADEVLATLDRCGADGLDVQARPEALSPALLEGLSGRALELACWTVDDPELARRMLALGATGITTNRPGGLRAELQP